MMSPNMGINERNEKFDMKNLSTVLSLIINYVN
jgi:hypothetical protein